jgi:hypothetical protein
MIAKIHKDEAVLTPAEADVYRRGGLGGVTLSPTIYINGANKDGRQLAREIDAEMASMIKGGRSQTAKALGRA